MSESRHSGGTQTRIAQLDDCERDRLLSVGRQRTVIEVLGELTGPVGAEDGPSAVSLEALAVAVAKRETGENRLDRDTVERTKRSLHHIHLPAMDRVGVVEFNPGCQRVEIAGPP